MCGTYHPSSLHTPPFLLTTTASSLRKQSWETTLQTPHSSFPPPQDGHAERKTPLVVVSFAIHPLPYVETTNRATLTQTTRSYIYTCTRLIADGQHWLSAQHNHKEYIRMQVWHNTLVTFNVTWQKMDKGERWNHTLPIIMRLVDV